MAFWNRRDKTRQSDGTKSLVIEQEATENTRPFAWPFASSYGMLYRRQPAVRTVVDFLARNIAQLNPKVYIREDNSDRFEVDEHPLAVLLRNPNPFTTRYRFFRDTVADLGIYDRAYWVKDRIPKTQAIVRLSPTQIVRSIEKGQPVYRNPAGKVIPRDELVVFSGYCPDGNFGNEDGVSPLETLRRVLAEEWAGQDNRMNMWRNSARQSGAIQRPLEAPEWSDEARQRFRADWESTMAGGGNAGRTAVLEEGMVWNPSAFSPEETEYIAGRDLTFREVCREYGMSPQLFSGDSANANIEAFHRHLYQDTLGPWLRMIQDEIELQLLPDVDNSQGLMGRIYVEFNLAEKLRGSFEEQARSFTTLVGVPVMAVNEGRARLNLPRINDPGLDEPVQPMNVLYGGQPAVTVPTEVPQPKRQGSKAAPSGALRRRNQAAAAHTELFRRYFRAQEQAFEKSIKKDAPFDLERWNAKLAGELYAARVVLARRTGKLAAKQIDGVYDEAITLNYLQETARAQAEGVNKNTAAALAETDDAVHVFEIAKTSRSEELGISTATALINFARNEAGKQSERADGRQRTKTWVVTSANSRHPELNGETVDIGETFSNGAEWPGDPSAGVDQVAGCQCLTDLN